MTQKFLDLFFKGRWHNYGHWSISLVICLASDLFIVWWVSALLSISVGLLWEAVQWRWDSGWNWTDITYNVAGVSTFLVLKQAQFLLPVLM